jgi:flagellar basal body-associated protein FliL
MSQIDEAASRGSPRRRGSRGLRFWIIIVALPMMIAAAAGVLGYWYFFLRERTKSPKRTSPRPSSRFLSISRSSPLSSAQ